MITTIRGALPLLMCGLLIAETTTLAQPSDLLVNLNVVVAAATYTGCADPLRDTLEGSPCDALDSPPAPATNPLAAWIVMSDCNGFEDGLAALEFGLEHDLDAFFWTSCTGGPAIASDAWPGTDSGIVAIWDDACVMPATPSVTIGYFIFNPPTGNDDIWIRADPRSGRAAYTTCADDVFRIAAVSLGGGSVNAGFSPRCATCP